MQQALNQCRTDPHVLPARHFGQVQTKGFRLDQRLSIRLYQDAQGPADRKSPFAGFLPTFEFIHQNHGMSQTQGEEQRVAFSTIEVQLVSLKQPSSSRWSRRFRLPPCILEENIEPKRIRVAKTLPLDHNFFINGRRQMDPAIQLSKESEEVKLGQHDQWTRVADYIDILQRPSSSWTVSSSKAGSSPWARASRMISCFGTPACWAA